MKSLEPEPQGNQINSAQIKLAASYFRIVATAITRHRISGSFDYCAIESHEASRSCYPHHRWWRF